MIYLDNAATTKIDPEVLDAMLPYLTTEYGNAGALYDLGLNAKKAVEKAREQVASFLNAESPEQIIFTSGGTESNNTVIHNWEALSLETKNQCFITSSIEHDSVARPIEFLRTARGYMTFYVDCDRNGKIDLLELERLVKTYEGAPMVNVMYMNNEIGSINPIPEIGDICNKYNAYLHTDCVQAAGCIKLDVQEMKCSSLSISSHKIHGPKGIGALYCKDTNRLSPLVLGGHEQEFGMRGGTENVAGIVGFGKACEIASKCSDYTTDLKRLFWDRLINNMERVRSAWIVSENANSAHTPGKILSFRVHGVDAETMVLMLGARGVCISSGSACRNHEQKPSNVLLSIGLSPEAARESLRVSFSKFNTVRDVIDAVSVISDLIAINVD